MGEYSAVVQYLVYWKENTSLTDVKGNGGKCEKKMCNE